MLITKNKFQDMLLWLFLLLITVSSFCGTYLWNLTGLAHALLWGGWLVVAGIAFLFTSRGKQILVFAKASKVEVEKVVWPTRQETIQTTSIVVIMVVVTGFVLWGIDSSMMWAIGKITHLG